MRILLIRHGESEHARRGLMSSDTACPGLTARGRDQAATLRDRFADERITTDALWCGTAARARQTAAILADGIGGPIPRPTQDLCEILLGDGEGLTESDFVERYGDPGEAEPDVPISPGGESWRGYERRVDRTLPTLLRDHDGPGPVIAVTHAGFVVTSFLRNFAVPRPGTQARRPGTHARIDPDFCSITEWEYAEDTTGWRLIRYNDTAHLS